MFRSRTLATFLISSVFITPALAKCELSKYVFKDQAGKEAVVKDARECFAWYDREVESRSSTNICQTEKAVDAFIEKHRDRNLRFVGTRMIKILYKGKYFSIVEDAIVGSPWLFYSVKNFKKSDYKDMKVSRNVYGIISTEPDEEISFDFSTNAVGWATPREEFIGLLFGVSFEYSRCQ